MVAEMPGRLPIYDEYQLRTETAEPQLHARPPRSGIHIPRTRIPPELKI